MIKEAFLGIKHSEAEKGQATEILEVILTQISNGGPVLLEKLGRTSSKLITAEHISQFESGEIEVLTLRLYDNKHSGSIGIQKEKDGRNKAFFCREVMTCHRNVNPAEKDFEETRSLAVKQSIKDRFWGIDDDEMLASVGSTFLHLTKLTPKGAIDNGFISPETAKTLKTLLDTAKTNLATKGETLSSYSKLLHSF